MTRKKFNADLAAAAERAVPNITDLRKGESDGEVVFTYSHPAVPQPVQVRLLGDVDEYPGNCTFMVYTDSEEVPQAIIDCINTVGDATMSKTVSEIVDMISRKFTLVTAGGSSSVDEDSEMTDADTDGAAENDDNNDSGYEDSDDYDDDDGDGDYADFDAGPNIQHRPPTLNASAADNERRLKEDLRKARAAGFKVGIASGTNFDGAGDIISLSIRVRRLGLPEETLEAWDLAPTEYIVLLIRYTEGYPTLSQFVKTTSYLEFLVGKCPRYKPSRQSAMAAFIASRGRGDKGRSDQDQYLPTGRNNSASFSAIYISNSLERFMLTEFAGLLHIRVSQGFSWDGARDAHVVALDANHRNILDEDENPEKMIDSSPDTDIYFSDAMEAEIKQDLDTEEPSICLHAMHFVMTHLVKCTNYCMVCHRRASHKFEAVKPYVCDIPLCEFQYMELGFGPSIEHEILNQPYVVDLLVSFCYAALANNETRGIPKSLHIKVPTPVYQSNVTPGLFQVFGPQGAVALSPGPGASGSPAASLLEAEKPSVDARRVIVSLDNGTVTFEQKTDLRTVKRGDYFVLISPPPRSLAFDKDQMQHHCSVVDIQFDQLSFKFVSSHRKYPNVLDTGLDPVKETTALGDGKADLFFYDKSLEELPESLQPEAMLCVLQTLPSVMDMRKYLIENPGRRLLSWDRISSPAMALLRWIIASNRSYIVQLDKPSEEDGKADKDRDIKFKTDEKVDGMGQNWAQFRFAQGSPTKEECFHRELDANVNAGRPSQYPTLFAWHGSPLKNWHNIIREGLTFSDTKYIAHGRAYGHGVYFSNQFATSSGYSGRYGYANAWWPNSQLRIASAISLCEIVNRPDLFVSSSPYYVVNQVDWIQCRYLFVQTAQIGLDPPAIAPPSPSDVAKSTIKYLEQDPSRLVTGPSGKTLQIPETALPKYRRQGLKGPGASSPDAEELSDPEDSDDVKFLDGASDEGHTPHQQESHGSALPYVLDAAKTSFRPGDLDLNLVPKLPSPTWATNTGLRQMSRELSRLQKVQSSTPQHELGWYMDFEKVDNMFQWIIELHSFEPDLPLAQDMAAQGVTRVVLEVRFGREYPVTPPFVRVVRPRFTPFIQGGGGHVTGGGAMCMELLTNSGWSPANSMESVLLQVRMALCNLEPQPARLQCGSGAGTDYGIFEALEAFRRAAMAHGWIIPPDLDLTAAAAWGDPVPMPPGGGV